MPMSLSRQAAEHFLHLSEMHQNDLILGHPEAKGEGMTPEVYKAMLEAVRTKIVLGFLGDDDCDDTKETIHAMICRVIASNPENDNNPEAVKRIASHMVTNETRISHIYESLPGAFISCE
mmetsp:Transcript_35228/g.38130  ORF Transcript_35228/g.38130 Transcript_35228/m.38130 type:complete len:120 (+) Transcript_35228:89-448(+)